MDFLSAPAATAFDAVSAAASAAVYVVVGLLALSRAPRDPRVRVFLATAIASVAPYAVTVLLWQHSATAVWWEAIIVVVALSLMAGSLALLHFTQIFPWRRPWIRAHGGWLWGGYAAVLLVIGLVAFVTRSLDMFAGMDAGAGGLGAVSPNISITLVLLMLGVGVPVLFVLGVVVPFAALLSLYRTYLASRSHGVEGARVTTLLMLVSQMGGGVLTILIIPLLRFVAPTGPWVTIAAGLLFAFGLLMPLAFAAGVWQYRVLDLDPELPPQ